MGSNYFRDSCCMSSVCLLQDEDCLTVGLEEQGTNIFQMWAYTMPELEDDMWGI